MSTFTRRELMGTAALTGGAILAGQRTLGSALARADLPDEPALQSPGKLVTPNGWSLPHRIVDGVKVFHLAAEEVEHEFTDGLKAKCWGYNGSVHGPTIEAVEGDRVRIYVTNHLPEATTVHWHGVIVPNGMDGVGGLSQPAIPPGETALYEFTLKQHGTFMYHSHHDEMIQIALGLTGLFVIHPKHPTGRQPDRDYALMLHEWRIDVGADRPNPIEMTDFNVLTINGKVFPSTQPMLAQLGELVRIRIGNLSPMDHHPIHLHGFEFTVIEEDGAAKPEASRFRQSSVLVPVGTTRTIEFVADNPGDWSFHCHMTHHVMTQMSHNIPNLIGMRSDVLNKAIRPVVKGYMTMGTKGDGEMGQMQMSVPPNSAPMVGGQGPHDYITMGGMFTMLKVREHLNGDTDPGWYENPPGTMALKATDDALRRDAVAADGSSAPRRAK